MINPAIFLFYHYGRVPSYLCHAIEHVRIFNPESEIYLITDGIKSTSMMNRFGVKTFQMEDFHSTELDDFKKNYRHISCFNEKYERFVLERWFVTEIVRRKQPDRVYVMLDSDVAIFGNVDALIDNLPEKPILLTNRNPGFNFINDDITDFLNFINDYYRDGEKISRALEKFKTQSYSGELFTLGEMQLLFEYLELDKSMIIYHVDKTYGLVDGNIHVPQGFNYLQLRRRPRKKVVWKLEEGRAIPYFKRGNVLVKALALHFQGPGKRVFHRFNSIDGPTSPLKVWWWNQIFQKRWLANLM